MPNLTILSAAFPLLGITPDECFSKCALSLRNFPAIVISTPIAPAPITVLIVHIEALLNAVPLSTSCAILLAIIWGFNSGTSISMTEI